jgi:hypothetical protein
VAAEKLGVEEIQTHFKETWKSRSREARGPPLETMLDERRQEPTLRGGFWIPVQIDSAPSQAVRFAVEVMREWIKGVECGYEPRIKI